MCWERVGEFANLHLRSSNIVLVASASPEKLLEVKEETQFSGQVYSDPGAKLYRLFGTKRGVVRTFAWKRGLENVKGIFDFGRQGVCKCRWPMLNAGDPWLQGGVAIVSKRTQNGGGKLWFHQMETSPGYPIHDLRQIRLISEGIEEGTASHRLLSADSQRIPILGSSPSAKAIREGPEGQGRAFLFVVLFLAAQCYLSYIFEQAK